MSLISSAGNNFANIATMNVNIESNKTFQSNPQNNTEIRNPDAPQAVPQKDRSASKKQEDNIAGGFGRAKSATTNNISKTKADENVDNNNKDKADSKVIDDDVLKDALKKIQKHLLLNSNIKIKFVRDEETGRELVKMVDKSSDTVIRQIPSELAIKLSTEIEEMFKIKEGGILSEQV